MRIFSLLAFLSLLSCKDAKTPPQHSGDTRIVKTESQEISAVAPDYDTTQWMELTTAQGFALELRYADTSNFTGQQIYDCGRCFVRPEAGRRLRQLQRDLDERYGWRLRLFDCYRPRPAQQRLWEIMPNASYVTPPQKGSMHNRGLAVDLTIDDREGNRMDMGTDFDFFGKEAHIDHLDHPKIVLRNRRILSKAMELHGFKGIRTEWWHYSLRGVSADLSDWEWECIE